MNRSRNADNVKTMNKCWCSQHFICSHCGCSLIKERMRFFELDSMPMCKKCMHNLSLDTRRRIKKYEDIEQRRREAIARYHASQMRPLS